jgi:hypothetical protein
MSNEVHHQADTAALAVGDRYGHEFTAGLRTAIERRARTAVEEIEWLEAAAEMAAYVSVMCADALPPEEHTRPAVD